MGVAPPPPVPAGVVQRVASDLRAQRRARGQFPPGELGFSMRRTLAFERQPLPVLLRCRDRFGPVFTIRLLYAPVVFAIGPAANHYITVSHASNFRWRDGSLGDLIPLLGDGLLTTDGDYHKRARRIMLPAFHRERIATAAGTMHEEVERALEPWRPGTRVPLYTWTRQLALRIAMRALFGFDPSVGCSCRRPSLGEECGARERRDHGPDRLQDVGRDRRRHHGGGLHAGRGRPRWRAPRADPGATRDVGAAPMDRPHGAGPRSWPSRRGLLAVFRPSPPSSPESCCACTRGAARRGRAGRRLPRLGQAGAGCASG